MSKIIRTVRSGQITIPAEFREKLGIDADSLLQITLIAGELRIKPLRVSERGSGSPWLKELYDLFASVREDAKDSSEREIDATIDEAVKAVRKTHG